MGSFATHTHGGSSVTSRVIALALVLAGLIWGSPVALAAQNVPPAGEIVESAPIRGVPGAEAVIYRQNGIRLGAVVQVNGSSSLVWSHRLAAIPARLSSPGPTGLLQGVIRTAGSPQAQVFAYLVRSTGVVSAIAGYPSGIVAGPEGANFHTLSFTLKAPDAGHVGSVKYRFATTYAWGKNTYSVHGRIRVPDYATSAYPSPNATVRTKAGNTALIRLEVADTEALRNTGLMNRTALDPDSGMIFVWTAPVQRVILDGEHLYSAIDRFP